MQTVNDQARKEGILVSRGAKVRVRNRAVLQCDGPFHRRQNHCTLSHRDALTVCIGRFEDVMSGVFGSHSRRLGRGGGSGSSKFDAAQADCA